MCVGWGGGGGGATSGGGGLLFCVWVCVECVVLASSGHW